MNGGSKFYITSAIDYANGPPHLGHALEKLGADAMARYHRLAGRSVHFVIGMDEHGLNVLQYARTHGVEPQEWVDSIAEQFRATWRRLGLSNDDFIRTTEPRHARAVQAIIERMNAAGDLYRGVYAGYYCVGCESYKGADELVPASAQTAGTAGGGEGGPSAESSRPGGGEGSAGGAAGGAAAARGGAPAGGRTVEHLVCPLHPTRTLLWVEEENWFFRLSRFQEPLRKLIAETDFVQPEPRRNELLRVIEGGLEDLSVSRARLPWGIRWPGDPDQTVYVWIDALTNYLTAAGFPEPGYERYWPADVHVIGKDITRFHCIYWPAMLMSAGLELPRRVWAHGFLTFEGRRFSKSAGVWVELSDAIDRHGPDALRYYLLREVPWNGDGDFSLARFDERYTADLANDLGNLVNRTLSMVERYRGGTVPRGARTSLDDQTAAIVARYREAMDASLLHVGAATALELAARANAFVVERAPWQQAREGRDAEVDATLASLCRVLATLSTLLEPFLPFTMASLAGRLGLERVPMLDELPGLDLAGRTVTRGEVLFPKEER